LLKTDYNRAKLVFVIIGMGMDILILRTVLQIYSKDSKHRSDSLDEASQFSDLEDQIGSSPAHKPIPEQEIEHKVVSKTEVKTISAKVPGLEFKDQTLEFLKYESKYSAQIHSSVVGSNEAEKVPYAFKVTF
jgi:hypothetical protein